MAGVRLRARAALGNLQSLGNTVLRAYAHLVFSRSRLVGLVLLLATATAPRALLGALLGALLALGIARLIDIERETIVDGSYAVSALLLGMGVAQTFGLGKVGLGLLLFFAPLCVLMTAALRSFWTPLHLPVLSMPFLIAFYLLLSLSTVAQWPFEIPAEDGLMQLFPLLDRLPRVVPLVLRSVGALFFLPRCDAGVLILLALALHSRIATLLAVLACVLAVFVRSVLPTFEDSGLFHSLTYNAVFTAVGLGSVWFVPSLASFVLALVGTLLCALLTLGLVGPLARLGLPVLIIPFNATVILLLMAFRQRSLDRRPKSVDFPAGTPEQNLTYFRTRLLRFARQYSVRFSLPVRGAWTCTQGVDGPVTHQGLWRHAFDFEVLGPDGRPFAPVLVPSLLDCYAYRLPVLASAPGTVVKVVSTVPDNELGAVNLAENWGNLVILYHAPSVYSMVAHLQCGSVRVVEGQTVRAGDVLGLCGNSGRSAQPHVHFQLQSGPKVGDHTLPCWFADAIRVPAVGSSRPERVIAALCPEASEIVRNVEPDAERAAFFQFPYGVVWALRQGERVEHVLCDIDFHGHFTLRSREDGSALFYSLDGGFFTAYDMLGASDSFLQLIRAALSRVPLDGSDALYWNDYLPARMFRGRVLNVLLDFVLPFLSSDRLKMEFRSQRSGMRLLVLGESERVGPDGKPLIQTRAELQRGEGLVRLELTHRGQVVTVERILELAELHEVARRAA